MVSKNTLVTEANRFILDMQSNQQRYIDFLSTMAKYHKYGLMQQINLFFHAPAGASGAVASKAIWEKLGRKVADDARPIPIMAGSEYQEHVEEVFDVSETEGYQGEKITWEYDEASCKAYMDENFPDQDGLSMPERILNFTRGYTEALPWVQDKELVALSTAYVIMTRLGYEAEDELGLELMLHSWEDVNVKETLATVNDASKMVLNKIGEYIRKEAKHDDVSRTDGNGAGLSGDAGPLGDGRPGEGSEDEGTGRTGQADGAGQEDAPDVPHNPREVGEDKGPLSGGREASSVDSPDGGRGSTGVSGGHRGSFQPDVSEDEGGADEEERPEPRVPGEGLSGVHSGDDGTGRGDNGVPDPAVDGTGVTEEKQDSPKPAAAEEEVVVGYPAPTQAEREMANKLNSLRVPKDKYLEYAIASLHVEFYRWHQIREFGGGAYETDGEALNLVRNHIIATVLGIKQHGFTLPESENTPLPPEYPYNYMKLGTKNYEKRLQFLTPTKREQLIHELPPELTAMEGTAQTVASSPADEPTAEAIEADPIVEDGQEPESAPEPEKTFTTEDFSQLDFSADMSTVSGKRKVFERNMAAIRTVKRLEDEAREATPEELKVLKSYSGFGGLAEAFDQYNASWAKEYNELRSTLTDSEYSSARASTLNAHFTPPELIQGIYEGLEQQGFAGGNILEPSCGSGRFFEHMPETMAEASNIHGVELDPVTARIASKVYKKATISNQPFERTNYADNSFDLAISNVPFGDYRVTSDIRYKKQRPYIHDYFISKMVDEVRPGGLVVVMTSSGTMDKASSRAREDIAAKAELVGAIRLPNTAFNASGTSVTSDILILKKRETPLTITKDKQGFTQGGDENFNSWVETASPKELEYKPINRYFDRHPENVLGKLALASGPYGNVVTCEPEAGMDLKERIAEIISGFEVGYEKAAEPLEPPVQENVQVAASSFGFAYENGRVVFHDVYGVSQEFQSFIHRQLVSDATERQRGDKKARGKVMGEEDLTAGRRKRINAVMAKAPELEKKVLSLIRIRDAVREVFEAQTNACANDELEKLQEYLNQLYDQHVKRFGRIYQDEALLEVFRNDPTCPLMEVLEKVDKETGVFLGKADIFTDRTVMPDFAPQRAESTLDALAFSMQEKGRVDVSYMASLMPETDVTDILKELTDKKLIFHDYEDDSYKIADEYLSGNVRAKLRKLTEERKNLILDRGLAVAKAIMPDWQPTFTPGNDIEKRMLDIIQDTQQYVRSGNGKVRRGALYQTAIYGFYEMPRGFHEYFEKHKDDREFMARYAGAMRELNGNIPTKLRNDPLFALEAFRCGVKSFDHYDIGGALIREIMGQLDPSVDIAHYFQPAFLPYYSFLKEKFSETDYNKLDAQGKAGFLEAVKSDWPVYKATYDKNVEELLHSRQNEEITALQDRLKDLSGNIEALEEVKPADIPAEDIRVTLGATWLPIECVKNFIKEELDLSYSEARRLKVEYSQASGKWHIDNKGGFQNARIDQIYGTKDINALNLAELALNLKQPHIYKTTADDKRVIDPEATSAAQMKQEDLKNAFRDWLMKDEKRAQAVVALYNEKFNAIVPREYNGEYLRFPGMNPAIQLKEHQKSAIAHTLYGGNTLFAHAVGGGKTYEIIASAMEAKRLGLSRKALLVVPKHLTEQTGAAFMKLYPQAKILVAQPSDFEKKNRKAFVAKVATQNWDGVIMGYTQFERIPITPERRIALMEQRIGEYEESLDELRDSSDSKYSIKQLESMLKKARERLEAARAEVEKNKDDMPIYFEELGIDRLYVDEAHNFKNCYVMTKMNNVAGIGTSDSVRANDLLDKCQYINEKTNYKGVVFATGTPVSNSMTELYIMQRYLQPQILREAGIYSFDDWAATFGEAVTGFELKPEGKGFMEKTRFSRFFNLPELMSIVKVTADIKTADMLDLDVPNCEMIVDQIEPTETQKGLVDELAARAEIIRQGGVDPSVDNMLKITNEGRMLALDERIIDPTLPDNPESKVNKCIKNVLEIYKATEDKKSTQLIFCDKSVPNKVEPNKFNVYDDIRKKLVEAGVPREEIAFVQEAKDDEAKEQLFAKVRAGKVRVLLGGTDNLGVGTNVQDKLIATHDLDVPWRPADLEQRLGRIVRRGNENKEVKVFRYVTKGTFDAFCWQLIENKQRFISQIMSAKVPTRESEDCDEIVLTAAEIKALAAGDPMIKEKMDVDNAYNRLKLDKATFMKNRDTTANQVKVDLPNRIVQSENQLEKQLKNKELWENNTHKTMGQDGEAHESFSMTINGNKYLDEKEAVAALENALDPNALTKFSGEYKGFKLSTAIDWMTKQPYLQVTNTTDFRIDIYGSKKRILTAIREVGTKIDKEITEEKANLETLKHNLEVAKKALEAPYPREEEFQKLKARSEEIDMILAAKEKGLTEEKDIEGDVRRSRILKLVDKDGHMDFTKLQDKSDLERSYIFQAAEALTLDEQAFSTEKAMSTDKRIAERLMTKGYDRENIYKTIEELSPSMIKAGDVKRLVGERKEIASMAVTR